METLSYCAREEARGWEWCRAVWRNGAWICFGLAVVSGPLVVLPVLNQGVAAGMLGRMDWQTVLGVAAGAQVGVLVLWMGMLLGLVGDERQLTDAEEAAIGGTIVLLVFWGIMDLLIGAGCCLAEMGM